MVHQVSGLGNYSLFFKIVDAVLDLRGCFTDGLLNTSSFYTYPKFTSRILSTLKLQTRCTGRECIDCSVRFRSQAWPFVFAGPLGLTPSIPTP